jgi:hypothetical protein
VLGSVRRYNKRKNSMTILRFLGATATVVALSVLAGPVLAEPPAKPQTTQVCDHRDPGNPYSEKYDYWEWSAYRARGTYDTRAEWTCQPIPPVAHQKGWLQEH